MSACRRSKGCFFTNGHADECVTFAPRAFAQIPAEPWTEIAYNLYQGSSYEAPRREDFDAVLTLYKRATPVEDGVKHREWFFDDANHLPDLAELGEAVHWVRSQWLEHDRRVLVRCQAGLNRSGLVVATVLAQVGGDTDEVIRLIRERRSPWALCNPTFEQFIREL